MTPHLHERFFLAVVLLFSLCKPLAAAPRNNDHPIATAAAAAPLPAAVASAPAARVEPERARGLTTISRLPVVQPARQMPAAKPAARTSSGSASGLETTAQAPRPQIAAPSLLCVVADGDNPSIRAAISAITGGVVDYFNAETGTPTPGQLLGYSCVFTYPNSAYNDKNLLGDRLADYVDAGGKVILGPYCTFTDGFPLGGRILTSAYSPVTSPNGGNHHFELPSAYAHDGSKSLHAGVLNYDSAARDSLVLQGAGIVNGHYADGEIAQAYRPDGRVVYSNGSDWTGGTGDWDKLIANIVLANPTKPALLVAPADPDDPGFRFSVAASSSGIVDYFYAHAAVPSAELLATYECIASWPDQTYFDPNLMGDRLADRVDAGGRVILAGFSTYSPPFNLAGRITSPDYMPVASPGANNHFSFSSYAGDGVSSLFAGVGSLSAQFRDFLIGQGNGIVDGHWADGEILAAYRPDGRVMYVNGHGYTLAPYSSTGQWGRLFANAIAFTPPTGPRILYAPSDLDFPDFRAKIAAQTGGVVDFFNAKYGTPTLAQLQNYDCVYTWVDSLYADPVLMGNNLADYVDAGGKVILGAFTTFHAPFTLKGRIMTPAYNPVTSPNASNHYSSSTYNHDGTACMDRNILDYQSMFRDSLVLQGSGVADAHWADGEIALAYRPDRRVVYLNAVAPEAYGDTGDFARLIANIAGCSISSAVLYGCNDGGQLFVVNQKTGAGSPAGTAPTYGSVGAGEIECLGTSGETFVQGAADSYTGQRFSIGTNMPIAAAVSDGASFDGLEYALGRLYGVWMTSHCGLSTFGTLDPLTGSPTAIGPTSGGQVTGLAFDPRGSVMYGISGLCNASQSVLVRFDVTSGVGVGIGLIPPTMASLEFGPDGDLYAGGDALEGGHLYRVNTVNGAFQLVGNPGFGGISGLTLAPAGTVSAGRGPSSTLTFASPYPNPSRKGPVQFSFTLPQAGDANAQLFDVAGRMVWHSRMANLQPGPHAFTWNGAASNGARLGSGLYLMRLVTPSGERSVRVIRLD